MAGHPASLVGGEEQLAAEDQARSRTYALLGALLSRPPSDALLGTLRRIPAVESDEPMHRAWEGLRAAALDAEAGVLLQEFSDLFIGLGRGELSPYASVYLTGFLMEKPLAELRDDLARLGFAPAEGVCEPEDHAGALCEIMSVLIAEGATRPAGVEQAFFDKHVAPWMDRFFADLSHAKTSAFYRAVGRLGDAFIGIERKLVLMPA